MKRLFFHYWDLAGGRSSRPSSGSQAQAGKTGSLIQDGRRAAALEMIRSGDRRKRGSARWDAADSLGGVPVDYELVDA